MLSEPQLIPYQESPLPPGPWLVFAPHPDDEVFGMGGAIARAAEAGTTVEVVILTAGDQAGNPAIRQQESEAAGKVLGISRFHFWGLPDRQLATVPLPLPLLQQALATLQPRTVFLPGLQEYHPDHRAACLRLPALLQETGYGGGIWLYEISRHNEANRLVDISPVLARKRTAIQCFPSQLAMQNYEEAVLGINQSRAYTLPAGITHAEAFLELTDEGNGDPASRVVAACRRYWQDAECFPRALVSLIVRTRNRPGLLGQALASIASQSYDQIEVVVVNDGGCDVAAVVAEALAGRSFRIVDQPENRGRSAAANAGLDAATGKYLGFLDDDDALDPDHVLHLVSLQEATGGEAVVYAGIRGMRRDQPGAVLNEFATAEVGFAKLLLGNVIPIHAPLFPASLLAKGARFDEGLAIYEDWDFWLQLARLTAFVFSGRTTATYYMGGQSGASPLAPSVVEVETGARLLYDKWLRLIGPQQMREMGDLYRRYEGGFLALSREVAERDGRITQLAAEVAERDSRINGLAAEVAARDARINGLTAEVADQDARLTAMAREIVAQERQRADLTTERDALLSSTCWRITAPLRFGGHQAKRLRHLWRVMPLLLAHGGGFLPALRQGMQALRRDGLTGVRAWIRQAQGRDAHAPAGIPWGPAELSLDQENRYRLAEAPSGYTYLPPRRPVDLDPLIAAMDRRPLFSVVVPVYNTPPELLRLAVGSVVSQWYPYWELILADDASPSVQTQEVLASFHDPRVLVMRLSENQGIAGATNAALAKATGEFVVLLDHDDELTEDCLFELARRINRDNPDYIYSDEDKISPEGRFTEPHFKPDWSPDTMMSTMYVCHVSCIRRSLLTKIGGLRSDFDGCQDWDLVLRLTEQTTRISHLPRVLYHWRIIPASTAADIGAKPYVLDASRRVREDALQRRGLSGAVEAVPELPGYFRVNYHPRGNPLISIIIPTRDNGEILSRCVQSIETLSTHSNFELIVLDNGSVDPASLAALDRIRAQERRTVIRHDAPFNFSELNNLGVKAARGELLLFLNDDTEVLSPDWLERLAGYAQLPHVGAVGAKLLYPGGELVQHAGVVNLSDGPYHAFCRLEAETPGYFGRNLLEYNWLAVTGACLMVERVKFQAVGGFDESFPIAYNDVELCFRLHEAGYFNVVCQAAHLLHHESFSRGLDALSEEKRARLAQEKRRLFARHPHYFQHDPFHSPNLHPNGINFEVIG
ncbi:MAG: glycosyltransferase [Thermodesulfobacteriota bacterium]